MGLFLGCYIQTAQSRQDVFIQSTLWAKKLYTGRNYRHGDKALKGTTTVIVFEAFTPSTFRAVLREWQCFSVNRSFCLSALYFGRQRERDK